MKMTNKEYHAHPSISNSQLSMFSKDQDAIEWMKNCPVDTEKVKTLDFGTAMHAICLEPDVLETDFVTMPAFNLRTNAGKADRDAWMASNFNKKIITFDERKKLDLMFESIMAHPKARKLIEAEGLAEESFFWTDNDTGVNCRCRPDKLIGNLLVDLKTTPELSKFHYSVDDYRYFVQNAFYCDGVKANGIENTRFEFLVIQKTISMGRYPVEVVQLPDDAIEYGRALYKQDLVDYAEYLEGKRKPTKTLEMSYRFNNNVDELLSEVML